MKKVIRLTESDLVRIVKRVINESNSITISPYILTITDKGNIKVTSKDESKTYELYKVVDFFPDVPLKGVRFSDNGKYMTVSGVGVEKTKEIDPEKIKSIIKNNWNKKEVNYTTSDGTVVLFRQVK